MNMKMGASASPRIDLNCGQAWTRASFGHSTPETAQSDTTPFESQFGDYAVRRCNLHGR